MYAAGRDTLCQNELFIPSFFANTIKFVNSTLQKSAFHFDEPRALKSCSRVSYQTERHGKRAARMRSRVAAVSLVARHAPWPHTKVSHMGSLVIDRRCIMR